MTEGGHIYIGFTAKAHGATQTFWVIILYCERCLLTLDLINQTIKNGLLVKQSTGSQGLNCDLLYIKISAYLI